MRSLFFINVGCCALNFCLGCLTGSKMSFFFAAICGVSAIYCDMMDKEK